MSRYDGLMQEVVEYSGDRMEADSLSDRVFGGVDPFDDRLSSLPDDDDPEYPPQSTSFWSRLRRILRRSDS